MIPRAAELRGELIRILWDSPTKHEKMSVVIKKMEQLFPNLTDDERNKPYGKNKGSKSKFYNYVQVQRNRCEKEEFIWSGENADRGYWGLTLSAIKQLPSLYPEFKKDNNLEKIITADLTEFEIEVAPLEQIYNDIEGSKKSRLTSYYERSATNRIKAVELHGTRCKACEFDFIKIYGEGAQGFIEVHHLFPVSKFEGEQPVNPKTDLTVLCANCHRMIHKLSKFYGNSPLVI